MEHRRSKCKETQQHVLFLSLLSPIFASSRASLPSFAVLSNSFVNKGQWTHKLLILLNHTLPVLLKKKRQHLEITNRGRNPKTIKKKSANPRTIQVLRPNLMEPFSNPQKVPVALERHTSSIDPYRANIEFQSALSSFLPLLYAFSSFLSPRGDKSPPSLHPQSLPMLPPAHFPPTSVFEDNRQTHH